MNTYIITKQGQAAPSRKVFAESAEEARKKAVALFDTRKVSVIKI